MGQLLKSGYRNRLFVSYTILMLIVVFVFMAVLYTLIVNTSEMTALNNQIELTGKITSQVESFINEMDNIALQAMSSSQLLKYFIDLSNDSDPENYFVENALDYIDAGSLLATINGPNNSVSRISAYNSNGDYISSGILNGTDENVQEALNHKVDLNEWISLLEKNNGNRIILGPHKDFWSRNHYEFISVIRPLSNTYSSKIYGILEVQQDTQRLSDILSLQISKDMKVMLFDINGGLIMTNRNDTPDKPDWAGYYEYISAYLKDKSKVPVPLYIQAPNMEYLTWDSLPNGDLVIVTVQNRPALLRPYRRTFTTLVFGGILVFLIMTTVVYIISGRLTKPIRQLKESIKNVSLVNLSMNLPYKDDVNEIAMLDSAFQAMFQRLSESIKLEMKAHLLALQSQMNPHFLFNMLAVISASGEEAGNEKTVKMCAMLSAMLRYIASYNDINTTMGEEAEHTRNYLNLMKERYEDCFSFDIHMSGGIEGMSIFKLILQPIVENCFQHGFKNIRPPWKIMIDVGQDSKKWWISVKDNGSGISKEEKERIMLKIQEYGSVSETYQAMKLGGLGLVNTILRLKLLYDENVYYAIESDEGRGTTITIGGNLK